MRDTEPPIWIETSQTQQRRLNSASNCESGEGKTRQLRFENTHGSKPDNDSNEKPKSRLDNVLRIPRLFFANLPRCSC